MCCRAIIRFRSIFSTWDLAQVPLQFYVSNSILVEIMCLIVVLLHFVTLFQNSVSKLFGATLVKNVM